jgi:sulfite reductase (NADPH) flavoprotein alpha-component
VHHLELLLEADDFAIEPGDAVGIQVRNPAHLVNAVLKAAGLQHTEIVTINHRTISLDQALTEECDITIPSKNFLAVWPAIQAHTELIEQWNIDSKEQRNFLRTHQLLDLLVDYPVANTSTKDISAQAFVESLRPLQPRLYDVANSLKFLDDELHLTVKKYVYAFHDREETGIASDYLINLQKNDVLHIYPHRNARFHLPEETKVPLILIADGTGIAPYRAFLQELQASERSHPCWLIFSEERFEEDFLYQLEWQQALEDGLLKRVDTLFYQDQPEHTLAELIIGQPKLLSEWLNIGAHLYLCGDKDRLTDCENTLQSWATQAGHETRWSTMNTNKHIHRNLY